MTLQDAIRLLFQAADQSLGGEIFVMTMPTCRIADLADVLMDAMGKRVKIVETGIRPGEKIHEILLTEHEAPSTVVYDDRYLVIVPALDIRGLREHYAAFPPVSFDTFSSSQGLMGKAEILSMLKRGGFLP